MSLDDPVPRAVLHHERSVTAGDRLIATFFADNFMYRLSAMSVQRVHRSARTRKEASCNFNDPTVPQSLPPLACCCASNACVTVKLQKCQRETVEHASKLSAL